MPAKKRLSLSEAAEAIKAVITAKGGKVNHAELSAALDDAGNEDAILQINAAVQTGAIKAEVAAQPTGKPIRYFTL